jgi:tetratricopeptide (TPR) repeat protein
VIAFVRPQLLLLALPWVVFWIWFARRQRRSCEWVWQHVHDRFRERFTLYRQQTLGRRLALLLVLGLLLVLAAAGPTARGETEVRELTGRVVLLLDGSASMLADDVPTGDGQETRFARGRGIAVELGRRLVGSRFALVVFSGVAALQLPMTADTVTIEEALGAASFHTFYRSSGSSFTAALDSALHFVEPGREDLQAVLLSDGEQPFDEPFDEPLAALAEAGVAVHTVAIGSREGQTRLIFDFRDVVAQKEDKRVLREYTTRREDRHLRRIARATGGRFTRADGHAAEELAAAVERRIAGAESVRTAGWRDLSGVALALFLVGFLLEAMVWGRRGRRPRGGFDIGRLGEGRPPTAAVLILLLTAGLGALACRDSSPAGRASRENERGIAADALGSWPRARVHYDRSRAFGVRPEIPAFNLARSVTLQEDWSEAHELYQGALEMAPRLAVAHYNDGHVLYRWGEAELDLESCQLERTLELWDAARRRFAGAAEIFPEESAGRRQARDNLRFVARRMARVEEACAPPPQAGGAGGEGEQQGGGGGEGGSTGAGGQQEDDGGGAADGGADGGGEAGGAEGGGEDDGETGDVGEDEGGDEGDGEQEGGDEGEGEDEGGDEGEGEDEGGDEGEGEDEGGDEGEGEDEGEDEGGDEGEGEAGGGQGESEDGGGGQGEAEGESGGGGEVAEGAGGGGPTPLTGEELERIRQALSRIAAERFADGRYHYRSLPEQFPREVWQNPEAEIWW